MKSFELGNRKKKNKGKVFAFVGIFIICGYIIYKNYSLQTQSLWDVSVVDIITLLVGVYISFYLTEKIDDKRRRNDCIEHVILEIEQMIRDDGIFAADSNTLLRQSSCANRIMYLQEAGFSDIQSDLDFIRTHFEEIRSLYSDHSQNEDEINLVMKDFRRHQDMIIDKCNKIRIDLYKS